MLSPVDNFPNFYIFALRAVHVYTVRVGDSPGEPGRAFGVKPGFAGKDMPCHQHPGQLLDLRT